MYIYILFIIIPVYIYICIYIYVYLYRYLLPPPPPPPLPFPPSLRPVFGGAPPGRKDLSKFISEKRRQNSAMLAIAGRAALFFANIFSPIST